MNNAAQTSTHHQEATFECFNQMLNICFTYAMRMFCEKVFHELRITTVN